MFQTAGFFQGISCPYYMSGYCERPNCHYSHAEQPAYYAHSLVTPSTSLNTITAANQETSQQHLQSNKKSLPCLINTPVVGKISAGLSESVEYRPTPISKLKSRRISQGYENATSKNSPLISPSHARIYVDSTQQSEKASADSVSSIVHREATDNRSMHTLKSAADSQSVPTLESAADSQSVHTLKSAADSQSVHTLKSSSKSTSSSENANYSSTANSNKAYDTIVRQEYFSTNKSRIHDTTDAHSKKQAIYSKQQIKEMTSLFGANSSDEEYELPALQNNVDCDSDDVIEVEAPLKPAADIIDLTTESDEEPTISTSTSSVSDSLKDNLLENINEIDVNKDQQSSSTKNHKRKKSRKDGENHEKAKKQAIAVSGASDMEQCQSLYKHFDVKKSAPITGVSCKHKQAIPLQQEAVISQKRTAREIDEKVCAERNAPTKRATAPSASEVLARRMEKLKEQSANASPVPPTISSAQKDKEKYLPKNQTVAQTSKHTIRKAHTPVSKKMIKTLERPLIVSNNSKVSCSIRNEYLNKIIDECLPMFPEPESAYSHAQREELTAFNKSANKKVYFGLIANIIVHLRKEKRGAKLPPGDHSAIRDKFVSGERSATRDRTKVSHEQVLAGKGGSNITIGLKRRASHYVYTEEDISGDLFFKKLRTYLLDEDELVANGFPRPDPNNRGTAIIQWSAYDKVPNNKGNQRTCSRCGLPFHLTPDSQYVTKEKCVHHWGKIWDIRYAGQFDKRYSCCEEKIGTEGCTIAEGHVHSSNKYEDLTGYMQTLEGKDEDHCEVYALDCEMVHTTIGLELARVTVVDDKLRVVYDTVVKPANEVVDYNTRFSGLTEESFVGCETGLKDVQAYLLSLIQADTVLIGHSLNSDMVALKMIHSNIVDTSVVWPNNKGASFKRALKTLMVEVLQKLIQETGSNGHDSTEDAKACMELMKWKVLQDVKKDMR